MFFKPTKKLTIQQYTPIASFISPVQKYNQRSFSAKSLPQSGSLRDQIRLESFKKSVLGDTKLNKTALNRATLKVNAQQRQREQNYRQQYRDLNYQILRLKQQNIKLSSQNNDHLLLVSRQNQLIKQLQKELSIAISHPHKENPCQCYMSDQYKLTIRNLQIKIRHLEEEKKEYKQEIRSLVIKQEELKFQLNKNDQKLGSQIKQNRKLHNMIYDQNKQIKKQRQRSEEQEEVKLYQTKQKKKMRDFNQRLNTIDDKNQNKSRGNDLKRYYDYLKNIRNRQIDQIENILNE